MCGPIWSGKPKPLRQPRARAGGGGRGAPARPSTPSAKSKVVTGERRIVLGKGIGTDTYLRCSPSSRGRGAPPPTGTLLARRPAGTVGSKTPRNRGRPSGVRPVFFFPKKNPEPWGLPPGTGAGPRRQGTGPHPFSTPCVSVSAHYLKTKRVRLLAVDHSARASMKNAASCEN